MGWGSIWCGPRRPEPAKVGRPDRGDRAKTKAARKANKHRR